MKPECPTCPRCGYDLSGEVATWTEACPLTGVCPECGYQLDWALAWRRYAGAAWWLFELDNAGHARAFVLTARYAMRQRRFWRSVRVEDRPQGRRLALFLVLLAAIVHLLIAIPAGLMAAKGDWGPIVLFTKPAPVVPPFSRPLPPMPVWPAGVVTAPPTYWERFRHALMVGGNVLINPYEAAKSGGLQSRVSPLGPSFFAGVMALFVLPLTIGAARGVFREGRAKAAHFWRVWVYGWVGPASMVVLSAAALLTALQTGLIDPGVFFPHLEEGFWVMRDPTAWLGPAMFAWAARWWYVAADHYLKWDRPLAVSLAACTASFFTVFGVMLLWEGWDYILQI